MEKEVEKNKIEKWVGYLEIQKSTDELIEELRGKIIKETDFGVSDEYNWQIIV